MELANLFINASDYKIQSEELGKGPHGAVYIAEKSEDKSKYVAKIINVENSFDGNEQALFLNESLTMHKLKHPAIAELIGINFMSLIDQKLHKPTIVTNYFPNGSLKDIVNNKENNYVNKQKWTPTKKYINLLGICDALGYLHDHGIIALNLKPENILFDFDYYPQISDYYISKCFSNMVNKLTFEGQINNIIYLAPEILQDEAEYDESADVYSFSMIAYQIITEQVPYKEMSDSISLKIKISDGYRPELPEYVPQNMKNLISRCWSQHPEERPTFNEIFSILSSDMTYSIEKVDEDEICRYLDMIYDSRKEQNGTKTEMSIEERINDLKSTMFYCFWKFTAARQDLICEEYLECVLKNGTKDILYEMGKFYMDRVDIFKCDDYFQAARCFEKSAERGNANAYEYLAQIYYKGKGVGKNYSKAKYYYGKAAQNGNSNALEKLGDIYYYGYGVDKDFSKAKYYYEKAEIYGNLQVRKKLSKIYDFDNNLDRNCPNIRDYKLQFILLLFFLLILLIILIKLF